MKKKRRVGGTARVCSRVALYGTGSMPAVQRLMSALHAVFNCRFYGGFSRNGVWEALLSFDKNRSERPYEEEIEKCIGYFYKEGSVALDVLDSTVTRPVVAFLHRLQRLTEKFGKFPAQLTDRVRQYDRDITSHEADGVVLDLTGMAVNAENMLRLHTELQQMSHLVHNYETQISQYRTELQAMRQPCLTQYRAELQAMRQPCPVLPPIEAQANERQSPEAEWTLLVDPDL